MTGRHLSSRFSGVAVCHLAVALMCSASWATSVVFGTELAPPDPVAHSEQNGSLYESRPTYDLNQLIGNAPDNMTDTQAINDKEQIATSRVGPKGQIETELLTPTPIPLPSAPWAALTVLPLMLLARRYRRLMR